MYPRSNNRLMGNPGSRRHAVALSGPRTSQTDRAGPVSTGKPKQARKPLFVRFGPAEEGNILCGTRRLDSIRWIVYELRDGKVERGARKNSDLSGRLSSVKNGTGPCFAAPLRQHREETKGTG